MSKKKPFLAKMTCQNCGKQFTPYGNAPVVPPPIDTVICPHCRAVLEILWDEDLQKAYAKKKIGIVDEVNSKMKQLYAENAELKKKIDSLETQIISMHEHYERHKQTLDELTEYFDRIRKFREDNK